MEVFWLRISANNCVNTFPKRKMAEEVGRKKVLIDLADVPQHVRQELESQYELISWPRQGQEEEKEEAEEREEEKGKTKGKRLAECEAIFTYLHPTVDRKLLEKMPRLKVISNHGVGVDHIDAKAATELGIKVGNTPGVLDEATADLTMALLLGSARHVVSASHLTRSGGWDFPSLGCEVTGAVLGIVGMGRIGRQVAKRARCGFDMTILYYNPRSRDVEAETTWQAQYCASLDELLAASDFVSLHCPLIPSTHHLIGAEQLARMKPTATLINVSRGPVVDTEALYQALLRSQIRAAAMDVTDPEPLPASHPLRQLPNAIITPHLGSASDRTRARMAALAIQNLHAGLNDLPLVAQYN